MGMVRIVFGFDFDDSVRFFCFGAGLENGHLILGREFLSERVDIGFPSPAGVTGIETNKRDFHNPIVN